CALIARREKGLTVQHEHEVFVREGSHRAA
ncbi:MAG: hypothetical protein ACI9DC_004579, partial [Gammaproteobacteria bacterium]